MPREDFLTTGITIGRTSNRITAHTDGSMLFSDPYIPGVKLKDLLGGTVVIDPAIFVEVEITDYTKVIDNGQTFYNISIPHDWGLCSPIVDVTIWDQDDKMITVDTIQYETTYILIRTTVKEPIKVVLKKQ